MAELLIDTSVFIDYLKSDRRAHAFIAESRGDADVMMHGVVAAELMVGARNRRASRS